MKILVLAPQPFYQDRRGPISLKNLLEALVAAGHDLTAMVYPEGERISIPGCRMLRVRKLPLISNVKPGFSWKHMAYDMVMKKMTMRLLQQEKFDLIHAGEGAMRMARSLSKRFKTPYVYDMDLSLPKEVGETIPALPLLKTLLTRYEKCTIKGSAGVLVSCRRLEEIARSYGGSAEVQLVEDMSLFSANTSVEKRKDTDLATPKNTLTLMYVGNLEPHQGIDLLLEAFSLAYLDKEKIRLVIIGGEKSDISRYRRKARNLGVADGVLFTGPKPAKDLTCYLSQADILVSPAITGYITPMKISSYLDSGRPVLATRVPTHTQILDDSIAMLVDTVDAEMALGILQLARDEKLRKNLAVQARQRVEEEYSRTAFRRKLDVFYDTLQHQIKPSS